MKKTIIRLTESDLHNIVKECASKILTEVRFGGESFHGNNADDWDAMANIRNNYYKPNKDDARKAEKDHKNAVELGNKKYSTKGVNKAVRAMHNINGDGSKR